ncbi:MAG TPA: methyltransferase [Chloroflexota bacterium]|nr:methyltransferase [Chloroflexota bacterium]
MAEASDRRGAQLPAEAALFQLLFGYSRTQLIYVMAKLGLADLLRAGPVDSGTLARATACHQPTLHRLLRGLTNLGLLEEDAEGRFALTPLGTCLRSDVPSSLRGWALLSGDLLYRAWGDLLHSVQTGQTAFDHTYGMGLYEYLAAHPEHGEHFHRSMTVSTLRAAQALLKAYDFSSVETVVDVGGGHGVLLAAILRAHAHLRGVLFDVPSVVGAARHYLEAQGVAHRCPVIGGDFFTAVPSGGDTYLLSWVLLDWDDRRGLRILRNCRAVLPEHGRLLLFEAILSERTTPGDRVVGRDLSMLVMTGGRERTAADYRALLGQAGLGIRRILPTDVNRSVIEAAPTS